VLEFDTSYSDANNKLESERYRRIGNWTDDEMYQSDVIIIFGILLNRVRSICIWYIFRCVSNMVSNEVFGL
jgi:hypothetical protein